MNNSIIQKIETVLESLRPAIRLDGGDAVFVKYEDNIVYIRFMGACVHCPISSITLKMGIEESIKQEIPEVIEVVAVSND